MLTGWHQCSDMSLQWYWWVGESDTTRIIWDSRIKWQWVGHGNTGVVWEWCKLILVLGSPRWGQDSQNCLRTLGHCLWSFSFEEEDGSHRNKKCWLFMGDLQRGLDKVTCVQCLLIQQLQTCTFFRSLTFTYSENNWYSSSIWSVAVRAGLEYFKILWNP